MIENDLDLVAVLLQAMAWRDAARIQALIDTPRGQALPREVREEALLYATLGPGNLRAPMQTLLYERRLFELARAEEDRLRRAG